MNGTDRTTTPASGVGLARLWGAATLMAMIAAPFAEPLATFVPSCPFKALTGLPCPFCGTTRAALLLAHGQPIEAVTTYPLATFLWSSFFVGGLIAAGRSLAGQGLPGLPTRWRRSVLVIAPIAIVAGWAFNVATRV